MDQPAGLLARVGVLMDYYYANKAYYEVLMTFDNKSVVAWERGNPGAATLVNKSIALRKKLRGSGNAI